jgi:hypothetical protein
MLVNYSKNNRNEALVSYFLKHKTKDLLEITSLMLRMKRSPNNLVFTKRAQMVDTHGLTPVVLSVILIGIISQINEPFRNRREASKLLAGELKYLLDEKAVILWIPRVR